MDFSLIRWELAVAALAMIILLADLSAIPGRALGLVAALGLGLFLTCSFCFGSGLSASGGRVETAHGFYVLDHLAVWAKQFSMLTTLLTILMSVRFLDKEEDRCAEYFFLQLTGCLGMMLLASAANFVSMFIALELMTIGFFVLVSFQRRNILCLESGVKYLIYGALSSGILLYGVVLIYGATGETSFAKVASYSVANPNSILLLAGLVLVLIGIGFKISAVPFHWWTADVYEGAPTPTVALLSIGSKGAGFVLLIRILIEAFPSYRLHWFPLVCFASGASILVGSLGALSQGNLKRLMGYSSISHTGYMLLGIAASSVLGLSSVLYYLLAYLLANALVFGAMCETAVENPRQDIRRYSGLGGRSNWVAGALMLGLLSLSGIPPLAGFFGKVLVLRSVLEQATLAHSFSILLGIAVIGVVCSLYYYLGVIRTMHFTDTPEDRQPVDIARPVQWIFGVLMVAVIAVGFYQSPWWKASTTAISALQP